MAEVIKVRRTDTSKSTQFSLVNSIVAHILNFVNTFNIKNAKLGLVLGVLSSNFSTRGADRGGYSDRRLG